MEKHSEIGEQILRKVDDYEEIADIVRHHHERVDGHGYPDGLRGDEIPLLARIISVADAYNAMTSDRPYRDALPSRVARLRLAQAVESQFDTSVVAAFEAILAAADEDYRMGVHEEFVLHGFGHEPAGPLPSRRPCRLAHSTVVWVCQTRAASTRERTPSFSRMWRTWTLVVDSLMNRRRLISWFVIPWAINSWISSSRGERS